MSANADHPQQILCSGKLQQHKKLNQQDTCASSRSVSEKKKFETHFRRPEIVQFIFLGSKLCDNQITC